MKMGWMNIHFNHEFYHLTTIFNVDPLFLTV